MTALDPDDVELWPTDTPERRAVHARLIAGAAEAGYGLVYVDDRAVEWCYFYDDRRRGADALVMPIQDGILS